MRAVIQRVAKAEVTAESELVGKIGRGVLVLLGIQKGDSQRDVEELSRKILHLRIFPGETGKMNLSVLDLGAELLVVSQFTLYGETRKGHRPSFSEAAGPEQAEPLYEHFVAACRKSGLTIACGKFRAYMQIHLVNDGPVTLILDTKA